MIIKFNKQWSTACRIPGGNPATHWEIPLCFLDPVIPRSVDGEQWTWEHARIGKSCLWM